MQGFQAFGGFALSLCRADAQDLARQIRSPRLSDPIIGSCLLIIAGGALYGASIGWWRSPVQGFYTALKVPLLIFLTGLFNGLLNSILAMVLGSGLGFRQTALCQLFSFAIFGLVAGAVSPIAFFFTLNTPDPLSPGGGLAHSFLLLAHTGFIAYAGILGNWKLWHVLKILAPSPAIARNTLLAWLAGNLFLGAQFSWVLRPFFGHPQWDVQFLREHPLQGNFYEMIFTLTRNLFHPS
jgi:hypothetical protein